MVDWSNRWRELFVLHQDSIIGSALSILSRLRYVEWHLRSTQPRPVCQHVEVPRVRVSLCQLQISVGVRDILDGVVNELFSTGVRHVQAVVVSESRRRLLPALLDQLLLRRPHDLGVLVQIHIKFGELCVDSLQRGLYPLTHQVVRGHRVV